MDDTAKPIPGHPGYFATTDGRILSDRRRAGLRGVRWVRRVVCDPTQRHELRLIPKATRYLAVTVDGRQEFVHRLVLMAHVGPAPSPEMEVRHLDGDRQNNCVENLAWGTTAENAADKERHGRVPRGSANGGARLCLADVSDIRRRLQAGESKASIARSYGVDRTAIYDIHVGRSWRWAS